MHRFKNAPQKLKALFLMKQILLTLQYQCTFQLNTVTIISILHEVCGVYVTNDDNPPFFKYKVSNIGKTENNGTKTGVKIAVPLIFLKNFWRSLEMLLINCKVELSFHFIQLCAYYFC